MSCCVVCLLRRPYHDCSPQINPGQQPPFPFDLAIELESSCKFSLNSLMALLAILSASGLKAIQPVVLTLLIYTINLRLAANTCFLRNHPMLSRFLHVLPLLGTSCLAGVSLVFDLQSPAYAAVGLLLGVVPLVTIVIHHRIRRVDIDGAALPVRMPQVPLPTASLAGSVNATRL